MAMPMTATKTNKPATAGTKYRSAADRGCVVDVGVAVATGLSTANAAVACDP